MIVDHDYDLVDEKSLYKLGFSLFRPSKSLQTDREIEGWKHCLAEQL